VLDCRAYNDEKTDITWSASSIRAWLNGEFYEAAFTEEEKKVILSTNIQNTKSGNGDWTTVGGVDTEDQVFLLSWADVQMYFSGAESRKTSGTDYAKSKGAKFLGVTSIGIGETDWWTRSAGQVQTDACIVNFKGDIGTQKVTDNVGIRPAIWVDTTADWSAFNAEKYADALALMNAENYIEAASAFEALAEYGDSTAKMKECKYIQANSYMGNAEYDKAIQLFEQVDNYLDTYELCWDCRYLLAASYQDAGDYQTAANMFGEVGQYKDAMTRMKACYEKLGINVFYFAADTVNTGMDNGYSKSNEITGNDIHFGWRMGQFFMSGFTRNMENDDGDPLFIKVVGDSITLWFELEQDIDQLNGNAKLSVNSDDNGYDQYFGVQKTDFGRGTLVIRHANYQNLKTDPLIYTDYLLAKGTTAANTKVVINEEGDYEVALNYEIKDDELTHIRNKYGNYRVFFRFSVRNGNCMVYPFDVVTGAELQNTAVTENGFYLDLARSRYLDINVKRSVLVDNGAGVVEDERFNRPAKDGDQYTQEGIYTISVSNRYTGESTVKTIFVGSDELLQEYIANGFSMDRLK